MKSIVGAWWFLNSTDVGDIKQVYRGGETKEGPVVRWEVNKNHQNMAYNKGHDTYKQDFLWQYWGIK